MKRASASTGIFPGTKPGWAAPTLIVPAMVCVKTWPPLASLSEGIGIVAVGTTVTRRPPHRSVLAELLHTAPASGSDAIALRWIAWRVRVCLRVPSTHFPPALCPACGVPSGIPCGYPPSFHRLRRAACPDRLHANIRACAKLRTRAVLSRRHHHPDQCGGDSESPRHATDRAPRRDS